MTWREYHNSTRHSPESLSHSEHRLQWENMPDPFRHYEGVPVLDLPADPPAPQVPALQLLQGASGAALATDGPAFLSQLLFHTAAISATKRVPAAGYEYALRVNPSSGNLHPTEFHFATRGLKQWPDGLYHYRPSSHMAEQRALGDFVGKLGSDDGAPVVFVLSSIAWREAWKYRERAYRYCLHDMGHAWEALALSARAAGCDGFAAGHFADEEVARLCGLHDDEWPMLIVRLSGSSIPTEVRDAGETVWFGGLANRLSERPIEYPLIESIHSTTRFITYRNVPRSAPAVSGNGEIPLPPPASSHRPFGEVARRRRSALNFTGPPSISFADLSTLLSVTGQPYAADFATSRFVQLYLYVHRVDGLEPGVYRYWPQGAALELLRTGDQKVMAAGLSLGQALAGNACVAFSMIGDIDRAVRSHGDRGYRYVHFEAGAIGHRLYMAAEALGLGATGIGAFFDDQVNRYLGLSSDQGEVVYHFAIGHPVPDTRVGA
jgi:SagB-type dehydrogenase family enzyme